MEEVEKTYIGYVTSGSFGEGIAFKLDNDVNPENVKIGDFVIVEGTNFDFLCIIDDIRLKTTANDVIFKPPEDALERKAFSSFAYNEISITPYLMFYKGGDLGTSTVKTLPAHFSKVRRVNYFDFERIVPGKASFFIGTPLTSDERLYIDLEKLSMRNTGLFGITGSGKSFLARIIFAGLIEKQIASILIFDMHNEHGKFTESESGKIESLASLFQDKVSIYDVSPENKSAASFITIPYSDVEVEDIVLVSDLLEFSERSPETLEIVSLKEEHWLNYLLNEYPTKEQKEREKEAERLEVNFSSIEALSRHLQRLKKLDYLRDTKEDSAIGKIIADLESGKSVVVQFSGPYRDDRLTYFFVSNIISRRIFNEFSKKEERNKRVIIAIEEAHKFLSKQYQANNVFGKIAREMRKFNVTLFIIDQRPSEIDTEVLSQIGTRLVMELKDEKDISAVFQGSSHEQRLTKVLSTLEQGQALVFGFAVPFPMPINVRDYKTFLKDTKKEVSNKNAIDDLY
jgi:DNA helicase HerA-like ATPase